MKLHLPLQSTTRAPFGPWERLERDWSSCKRCPLGPTARHHVLYELLLFSPEKAGPEVLSRPIEELRPYLLVGEAPGVAENTLGRPFIGPSGDLLRRALNEVFEGRRALICLSNVLACRPWEEAPTKAANRPPSDAEAKACNPRLMQLAAALQPSKALALGNVADDYLQPALDKARIKLTAKKVWHPAYVIRSQDPTVAYARYVELLHEQLNP